MKQLTPRFNWKMAVSSRPTYVCAHSRESAIKSVSQQTELKSTQRSSKYQTLWAFVGWSGANRCSKCCSELVTCWLTECGLINNFLHDTATVVSTLWRCTPATSHHAPLSASSGCAVCCYVLLYVHCESKKQSTIILSITSPNVGRFSKFVHWQIQ